MRLSDVKGDRVFDVLAEVIEPISNIAKDKECTGGLLKKIDVPPDLKGETANTYVKGKLVERVQEYAPKLLKKHKQDIIKIFALIENVSVEEYTAALTLPKLIVGLVELLTDEVFQDFFTSAQT